MSRAPSNFLPRPSLRTVALVAIGGTLLSIGACAELNTKLAEVFKDNNAEGEKPPTVGTAGGPPKAARADDALATQATAWKAASQDPIIKAGDLRDKGIWNDPCVLKEGSQYVMYLTTSLNEPFKAPVLPFRAVSDDGLKWTLDPKEPLIKPDNTGYVGMETPSVVKFKGKYHMYYSLINQPGKIPLMEIGHATSDDGKSWKLDPMGQPLIKATGNVLDWNGFLVGEPAAVVFKDKIYLYFIGTGARPSGKPQQLQQVALAISNDGRNFDPPKVVLSQDETLYPPSKGFTGYSCPFAVVYNNKVHIFHNVALNVPKANPDWYQVALSHAVSDDGETNWTQDKAPIYTRSSFKWTSGGIIGPAVLFEDGKCKMWFAGHVNQSEFGTLALQGFKGTQFGIGFASTDASKY